MKSSLDSAPSTSVRRQKFKGVPRSALILGVDDDRLNLKVTKSVVEGLGYVFIEANSGAECLRVLETVQPNVILLDVMMPEMDGFETCRRVRQEFQGAGPRILYLTARNLVEDVKHSVETGADDYLVKPIQMAVLKARLKHWLKQPPRGALETPPT